MYIHTYVYVYVYVYTDACHISLEELKFALVNIQCVRVELCIYIHMYIYMYMYMYIYMYICLYRRLPYFAGGAQLCFGEY